MKNDLAINFAHITAVFRCTFLKTLIPLFLDYLKIEIWSHRNTDEKMLVKLHGS